MFTKQHREKMEKFLKWRDSLATTTQTLMGLYTHGINTNAQHIKTKGDKTKGGLEAKIDQ